MALVTKRTAAAGGADATQTTAAGVWTQIDALLIAAGWTVHFDYIANIAGAWQPSIVLPPTPQVYGIGTIVTNASNVYQCIQSGTASTSPTGPTGEGTNITDGTVVWRFITSSAGAAKVYTSTGETGNERLFARVDHNTNATPSVNCFAYQYFSLSSALGYNRLWPNASVHMFTYTAGNTVNYVMVANKDAFQIFTNDNVNNRRLYGSGRLNRLYGVNPTYFVSDGTVTAGANKTYTFASGDPVAAGYKIHDRVFVVSQQTNPADPFNDSIPVFAANITAVTTNSITIDFAQETTSAGAFVGADPQCQFAWTSGANFDPGLHANSYFFSYVWNKDLVNLKQTDAGYANATGGKGLVEQGPLSLDPNARTSRVVIGEILAFNTAATGGIQEVSGILPLCYSNPRTTDALWAIGRSVKEPSNFDYVTFPANTASPTSQPRSELGPIAISGGSTYLVDIYVQNNTDNWIEAEVPETLWPQADKTLAPFMRGLDTWPWIADTAVNDEQHEFLVGIPDLDPQADKVGSTAEIVPSGELTPFDSAEATSGGNESGFNGGFN
jgi:hypothetical protein